jgi:hypothetical protein
MSVMAMLRQLCVAGHCSVFANPTTDVHFSTHEVGVHRWVFNNNIVGHSEEVVFQIAQQSRLPTEGDSECFKICVARAFWFFNPHVEVRCGALDGEQDPLSFVECRIVPPFTDANGETNRDIAVTCVEGGEVNCVRIVIPFDESTDALERLATAVARDVGNFLAQLQRKHHPDSVSETISFSTLFVGF